jgi:hypothetical protein
MTSNGDWDSLIELAEIKLKRIKLKESQLEALITIMRAKAESGEPSPFEIAKEI